MKIPLSDPIWTRLYGPYRLDEVAEDLGRLDKSWDEDLAKDLFWERLHHQDDLYPITFAALPWLWQSAPRPPKGPSEALSFFAHVLFCAMLPHGTGSDGMGPRGRYRGLSLKAEDHRLKWIPVEQHLLDKDMERLEALEDWFTAYRDEIASVCLDAVPADNTFEAVALAKGFTALNDGYEVVAAMEMWADGESMPIILENSQPTAKDRDSAKATLTALGNRNDLLSEFLRAYIAAIA